jgi:hypothetical protein
VADEPTDIGLDWRSLSVDDMKLVMDQADALSAEFPERPRVERFFSGIASAAVSAMHARDTTGALVGRTHSDVTTPSDLQIDDITVAVANISRLVEDGSQRPPVRALWGGILRVLSAEVRSREARR